MRVFKKFDLIRLSADNWMAAMSAIDQILDDLVASVNRVGLGKPVHNNPLENLDGVWMVVSFTTANTDTTFAHNLKRIPFGLMQVESPIDPGESLIAGQVLFKSATTSAVVLQSTGANKKARVFLF